ncbi:MAG: pilus assembly protein TadG-related protein [Candidatus Omnitrophica bacterium]|jgi:hypothetical protein|nr:pilus assembly protein TadG-related protein [Candidatus Omnitrophota bacterium]MDD5654779.1 pilus assembly protein TadG-related protein [Candidatus Omnitrophota bacterium]
MKKVFFSNDGQIAPFMIAIIVVLIMAIMVTVNIGKVGLTKTHTANAADAGALACSTMHANTLNTLADINTIMIAEYLSTQVMFLIPINMCSEWTRYISYLAFVAAQTAQYILAWQAGDEGYADAESAAKQMAFLNAGIDEGKIRLSGESYQAYLQRDSSFDQWMSSQGYDSGVYSWTDKSGGANSFTVDADAPSFPGLIPMPGILLGLFRDNVPPAAWCLCYISSWVYLSTYQGCVSSMGVANIPTYVSGALPCKGGCCTVCAPLDRVTITGGMAHGIAKIFPSTASRGSVVWNQIIYPVPIAFIANIVSDNPETTITTTRIEPNRDLGMWEMKYNGPSGGGIISSSSSRASGGAVGPIPNPRYDSYLIGGS